MPGICRKGHRLNKLNSTIDTNGLGYKFRRCKVCQALSHKAAYRRKVLRKDKP